MTDETKSRLSPLAAQDQPPRLQSESGPSEPGSGAELPRTAQVDVQAYIGRQLRAVYDDVAKQPVPDRFLDLMKKLEGIKPGE